MKHTLFLLLFFSFGLNADTLITSSYKVEIGACPEGYVTCDTIPVELKELKTGIVSTHIGETLHTLCKDGVTPCRFLGYHFTSDVSQYYIYENGSLMIYAADEQLVVDEQGKWSE